MPVYGVAVLVILLAAISMGSWLASAQDCPTARSARDGFVVERGERSKTEVFHVDDSVVRTILRYDGTTLLETAQFQGLFQLERLERGRKNVFRPKTDLGALFPLKPGKSPTVAFEVGEATGSTTTRTVSLSVKPGEDMYIGPCKYAVLKIERKEALGDAPPSFINFDHYAPELKLVLAKEYRERDGRTTLIKFDKIYPSKR
jgi:hypothetical protein